MKSKFRESRFFRNVLTLAGGAAAAQAVAFLSAPINTRLYSPADYGALGAYMSVSGLASTASTLFFHYPVVLTERDEDARALVGVCLLSAAAVTAVVAVLGVVLGPRIALHFGTPSLRYWFLVLPLSTFFAGVGASCSAWVNRKGAYKLLASSRVVASVAPAVVSIALGLVLEGPTGLLAGLATSHLALAALSVLAARRTSLSLKGVTRGQVRALARRYQAYPIYTMPTELMSNWGSWLPVHLLIAFAGAEAVGAYSMATRMLGLPATFIGSSVSEVFRQQAAAECTAVGECRLLLRRTVKHAALVAGPVFLIIALLGPDLFATMFGAPWRDAGNVARILAPLFCLQFIVSPVTVMYYVRNKLREDMILHILMLVAIAVGMSAVHFMSAEPMHLLAAYAASYGAMYLVYLVRSHQLSGPQQLSVQEQGDHGKSAAH